MERVKKLLLKHGADPTDLKRIERETKKLVDEAVEVSKASAIPPPHWGWKNVYVDPTNTMLRDVDGSYRQPVHDTLYKDL